MSDSVNGISGALIRARRILLTAYKTMQAEKKSTPFIFKFAVFNIVCWSFHFDTTLSASIKTVMFSMWIFFQLVSFFFKRISNKMSTQSRQQREYKRETHCDK